MDSGRSATAGLLRDFRVPLSTNGRRRSLHREPIDEFVQAFGVGVQVQNDGAQFAEHIACVAAECSSFGKTLEQQEHPRALLAEFG